MNKGSGTEQRGQKDFFDTLSCMASHRDFRVCSLQKETLQALYRLVISLNW